MLRIQQRICTAEKFMMLNCQLTAWSEKKFAGKEGILHRNARQQKARDSKMVHRFRGGEKGLEFPVEKAFRASQSFQRIQGFQPGSSHHPIKAPFLSEHLFSSYPA
jgi:hypothetical protein